MQSIDAITEFLGWCSIINGGLLLLSTVTLFAFHGPISRIHAKMFDLEQRDISNAYFQYLAKYKLAFLVLNVVPYFALKLMAP